MNKIRHIQELNKREIQDGVPPNASWHTDYRDTAFVYFGGLPFELSEGDIITIFSQYGEPVFLKLARDKETGKSKGFGWLKYEDQRSTDLAVDNLGGATIGDRLLHVDHARYKARDDEDPEEFNVGWEDLERKRRAVAGDASGSASDQMSIEASDASTRRRRGRNRLHTASAVSMLLPEELELQRLVDEHDDEDPMKAYLINEKKKEAEEARLRIDAANNKEKRRTHRHHRHHRHHIHHHQPYESDDEDWVERREHGEHRRRRNDKENRQGRGDHKNGLQDRDQGRVRDRGTK